MEKTSTKAKDVERETNEKKKKKKASIASEKGKDIAWGKRAVCRHFHN